MTFTFEQTALNLRQDCAQNIVDRALSGPERKYQAHAAARPPIPKSLAGVSKSIRVRCHSIEKRSGERSPRHRRNSHLENDVQTLAAESTAAPLPNWLWAAAVLGILWNLYGAWQYAGTFTPAGQAAMTAGTTAAQAALYLALPVWVSVVFAVGVFGGLVGSVLLALRRRAARPVFAASWVGYVLLFAADAYHGVFAAIPRQLGILAVVVLIEAALYRASQLAGKRGLMR